MPEMLINGPFIVFADKTNALVFPRRLLRMTRLPEPARSLLSMLRPIALPTILLPSTRVPCPRTKMPLPALLDVVQSLIAQLVRKTIPLPLFESAVQAIIVQLSPRLKPLVFPLDVQDE